MLTSTLLVKKSDAATEALGRSRGGFSTKVYAVVDALGNPLRILLRPGQKADISEAEALIEGYRFGALIAAGRISGSARRDSAPKKPTRPTRDQPQPVRRPKQDRAVLRPDQALPPDRHSIRENSPKLQWLLISRLNHDVGPLIVHTL